MPVILYIFLSNSHSKLIYLKKKEGKKKAGSNLSSYLIAYLLFKRER